MAHPDDHSSYVYPQQEIPEILLTDTTLKPSEKWLIEQVYKMGGKVDWLMEERKKATSQLEDITITTKETRELARATNGRVNKHDTQLAQIDKTVDEVDGIKDDIKLIVWIKRLLEKKKTWVVIGVFAVMTFFTLTNPVFQGVIKPLVKQYLLGE